jgi:hypothetical protein
MVACTSSFPCALHLACLGTAGYVEQFDTLLGTLTVEVRAVSLSLWTEQRWLVPAALQACDAHLAAGHLFFVGRPFGVPAACFILCSRACLTPPRRPCLCLLAGNAHVHG